MTAIDKGVLPKRNTKELIVSPSFIFTKNQLLYRFFKVLCHSCRTTVWQNISRKLLLKQTGKNYETYLTHFQPMFYLNPLIPTKKSRKLKVFWYYFWAWEGSVDWKCINSNFYSYYKKRLVIGLVQPYL